MKRAQLNYPMDGEVKALLDSYADKTGLKKYKIIELAITEYVHKHSKGK